MCLSNDSKSQLTTFIFQYFNWHVTNGRIEGSFSALASKRDIYCIINDPKIYNKRNWRARVDNEELTEQIASIFEKYSIPMLIISILLTSFLAIILTPLHFF